MVLLLDLIQTGEMILELEFARFALLDLVEPAIRVLSCAAVSESEME